MDYKLNSSRDQDPLFFYTKYLLVNLLIVMYLDRHNAHHDMSSYLEHYIFLKLLFFFGPFFSAVRERRTAHNTLIMGSSQSVPGGNNSNSIPRTFSRQLRRSTRPPIH